MTRALIKGFLVGMVVASTGFGTGVIGCGDTITCSGLSVQVVRQGTYELRYVENEHPLRPDASPSMVIDREAGTVTMEYWLDGRRVLESWNIVDVEVFGL